MTIWRALVVAVLVMLVVSVVTFARPEPAWVYQYSGAGQGPRTTAVD